MIDRNQSNSNGHSSEVLVLSMSLAFRCLQNICDQLLLAVKGSGVQVVNDRSNNARSKNSKRPRLGFSFSRAMVNYSFYSAMYLIFHTSHLNYSFEFPCTVSVSGHDVLRSTATTCKYKYGTPLRLTGTVVGQSVWRAYR